MQTVNPSIVTQNTLIDGCARTYDMGKTVFLFDKGIARKMSPNICKPTSLLKVAGRSMSNYANVCENLKYGGTNNS